MELTDALFDLCKEVSRPIIAIDGPAGAGKTTLAEHLSAALSLKYSTSVIHMDSLYNGWSNPFDSHLKESLTHAVASHKGGRPFSLPRYDWNHNEFSTTQDFSPKELLILEGVGSSQRAIRENITVTIWIGIDPMSGLQRVISRDGEGISEEMKRWLVQQEQHFLGEESEKAADFVLTT